MTHRPALRSALPLLALGAIALPALGACGPTAPASSAKATTSATSAPSSAPTPSTPSTPAATTPAATTTTTSAAPAPPRTAAELRSALLGLSDLPTGYSVEKDSGSGAQPQFSSPAAACRDLVTLLNTPEPPGAVADATVAFSGGQDGPFVSEQLDALPGVDRATAAVQRLAAGAAGCDKATISMPGAGRAAVTIAPVSPPQAGRHPTAFRVTAAPGSALDGFEVTFVATQVGDVTVALTFLGALPDEVDAATRSAVDKVTTTLGDRSGGAGV